MDTEPMTTVHATDTAASAAEAPSGFFQEYLAKIQVAMQKQIDGGVSADELGNKIFSSILNALEPTREGAREEATEVAEPREIQPDIKSTGPLGADATPMPMEVTSYVLPQATTTTQQLPEAGDDSVGVLVTAPPSAMLGLPSFEDIANSLAKVANEVKEAVKSGGKAVGDFVEKNGRGIVDGVAKIGQGMEDTEHLWDPSAGGHPDLGGGTRTEYDYQ